VYTEKILTGHTLTDATGYIGPGKPEFMVYGVGDTAVQFDDATMGRHVLYLGGIGTGKTVGISALVRSVRAWLTEDDVIVFFDTKGDYYEAFHQPGDAVIAATTEAKYDGQVSWNLFEEFRNVADGREVEDEILEVCNGLFSSLIMNAGDNAYFANAARDLFVALVTAMYRESDNRTNRDVRMIVGGMSTVEMQAMLDRPENSDIRGAKHYIAKEGGNSTMATMAFMQQAIQESFRSSFGRDGDFSIRRFLQEKGAKALFLEYDIAAGTMLSPVYKTMLDIAMKEAMSRMRTEGRVFFILDEFALLPNLTHLSNGLNFGRSLGLRFIVGTQNTNQVDEMYGEHGAASVLSSFGTVFAFRLYDESSRDFVRNRFGKSKKIASYTPSKFLGRSTEFFIEGNVVEDWDLSSLSPGTCIAAIPDQAPVRFTFQYQPL
jgi:hypothetical protein